MTLLEAITARHSVRRYTDQKIADPVAAELRRLADECNREGGLHLQLRLDEPEAFGGMMARYGSFHNVRNYLALAGPSGDGLQEACGYYGEKIVLLATQLGLNSCWVAATYKKGKTRGALTLAPGEALLMVVALGYGETQGVPHKSKPLEALYRAPAPLPDWFLRGVEAAALAPTAMNQQKFCFELQAGDTVSAQAGTGFYAKTDLGIAKYHFEIGAGDGGWRWAGSC